MDDLTKKGPPDRSRINIHEDWELKWWSEKLGVSAADLISAVQAVGVMAANVEAHLRRIGKMR